MPDAARQLQSAGDPVEPTVRGWVLDVALVLVVIPSAVPYLHRQDQEITPGIVLVVLLSTLPLLARRWWPVPVLALICTVSLGSAFLNPELAPSLAVLIALYTVAAQCPRRQALMAAGVLEIAGIAWSIRVGGSDWWFGAIPVTGMIVAALGLGLYSAIRRDYLAELTERARRLEFERDQQGELAAAAERARIAREIHDIVAHHLTVIVALSDGMLAAQKTAQQATPNAAPKSSGGPERVSQVLTAVSTTGRQALTDTRRLLGVLRDDTSSDDTTSEGTPRQPLPDLAGIDALIESVRQAGLPVSYEIQGSQAEVAPGVQLTAYRIVQEALTNTLKHAGPGASARVELAWAPGELRVDVQDDGRGANRSLSTAGAGRGLTGMRERVAAFDGDLTTGPRQPRGWHVSARLRLAPEATP